MSEITSRPTSRTLTAVFWVAAAILGVLAGSVVLAGAVAEARDQRADLDLFLEATSDGWVEASNEFFRSPMAAANLIEQAMGGEQGTVSLENLLATIQLDDDIDAAFVGRPDGSFLFAAHDGDDGFRTRRILPGETETVTELRWFDAELRLTDSEEQVTSIDEAYDPRARPWYEPIAQGTPDAWSDPYTFSSSGQPGITYSRSMLDADGELAGVIGVDVQLSALNDFLAKLRPGPNGQAALFDDRGQLVALAADEAAHLPAPPSVAGDAASIVELDGDRTASARRFGPDGQWVLMAIAQDGDFVGAEERALMLAARFLLAAIPTTIAAATLLRPLDRRVQRIYRNATLDPLTGLASRSSITEQLQRALDRTREDVVVAIIDLDGFKPVNDTWGHQHGDATLEQVGRRLREVAAMNGLTAGRLGGDEFLLFTSGDEIAETDEAWTDVVAAIRQPVDVSGTPVHIGASIGVAHVVPGHDRRLEDVLRRCDRALYTVKSHGGSNWLRLDGGTRAPGPATGDQTRIDLDQLELITLPG